MTTPADSVTPVAKLPTSERQRAVLRAAQLYFLDGLTQAAVAERMGCTRWTVGRLLKEGEDSGVVDIRIRHAQARVRPLEIELESRFGLADVQVVGTQETTGQTLALVAQTAADYLADIRPRPTAVALAWGRTTSAVARAAAPRWSPGTRVVQANAAPGGVDELLGSGATRLLARKAPGTVSLFDEVLENSLRGASPDISPSARRVVDEAESADVVIFSPGSIPSSSIIVKSGFLSHVELKELWERGARANVLGRLVDAEAQPVSDRLEERIPAMSLRSLAQAPWSIAVCTGPDKVAPLAATLKGRLANVLITDSQTATALLD